jgi:hypothetical protein
VICECRHTREVCGAPFSVVSLRTNAALCCGTGVSSARGNAITESVSRACRRRRASVQSGDSEQKPRNRSQPSDCEGAEQDHVVSDDLARIEAGVENNPLGFGVSVANGK